jgi:hypothetical protein
MNLDRRTILRTSLLGAGMLVSSQALAQPASTQYGQTPLSTLMTMVFLSKRLDASTAAFRKWYIEEHAPDYLAIAAPYLERYSQLFVDKAYRGPVDFDCISEFSFRSREAAETSLKALDSQQWRDSVARHPRVGSVPGPNEAHDGPRRVPIDERLLAGPPRGYDRPGTRKQVVLMRRKGNPAQQAFVHEVINYGSDIARDSGEAVRRMVLAVAVPDPQGPGVLYDAVYLIWQGHGASLDQAFASPPPDVEVVNILDVLSYEPDLHAI